LTLLDKNTSKQRSMEIPLTSGLVTQMNYYNKLYSQVSGIPDVETPTEPDIGESWKTTVGDFFNKRNR